MSKAYRSPTQKTGGGGGGATPEAQVPVSNDARLAELEDNQVDGPMGRVYQRILGVDQGGADMAFTREQLREYLDSDLQLAENEWFRGTKLDGVAEALMEQLDSDGDQRVSWGEFQAFEAQTLETVAPGTGTDSTQAEIRQSAAARFGEIDRNSDGRLSMGELQDRTRAELPRGTEHADLIAQLAARIALDAIDTDQRDQNVADRQLSSEEFTTAAGDMKR